jgi:hypothetical protein
VPVPLPLTHVSPVPSVVQFVAFPQVPLLVHEYAVLPWHSVSVGAHWPVHVFVTHVWSLHATAVPHVPPVPHVSIAPLPEHCVAPGVHDPVHVPPTHAELVHGTGVVPQVPVLHVTTPLLPRGSHSVWFGAQSPVQLPLRHVWSEHAFVAPHAPASPHASVLFPTHAFVVGAHATHVLFRHTGVVPAHVVCVCHVPFEPHD